MKRLALLIAFVLPVAACSSEPEVDVRNASVEEVMSEVAKAGGEDVLLQPGKWQTKVVVEDIAIPGMPAAAQAQMKDMFARQQNITVDQCITPEQAKRPSGDFFTGKKADNCRYDRFTMSGGKVDGVLRCTGEQSSEMVMTMSGTYTPQSSSTRTEMVMNTGQGSMTMKARSEARRVGACEGKQG